MRLDFGVEERGVGHTAASQTRLLSSSKPHSQFAHRLVVFLADEGFCDLELGAAFGDGSLDVRQHGVRVRSGAR
jgi:hypothetical protein